VQQAAPPGRAGAALGGEGRFAGGHEGVLAQPRTQEGVKSRARTLDRFERFPAKGDADAGR
jgi:hypothetical protein